MKVIIIKESIYESIVTDIVSFLCVTFLFAMNHEYMEGSWVIDLFVGISFYVCLLKWSDMGNKVMTSEEAIEYLKGELNEQPKT